MFFLQGVRLRSPVQNAITKLPKSGEKGTDLFFCFPWPFPASTFHTYFDLLFNFIKQIESCRSIVPAGAIAGPVPILLQEWNLAINKSAPPFFSLFLFLSAV
jgi:hypothetical protein